MSAGSGLGTKGEKNKKFSAINYNNFYQGVSNSNQKSNVPRQVGLQPLGKVGVSRRLPSTASATTAAATPVPVQAVVSNNSNNNINSVTNNNNNINNSEQPKQQNLSKEWKNDARGKSNDLTDVNISKSSPIAERSNNSSFVSSNRSSPAASTLSRASIPETGPLATYRSTESNLRVNKTHSQQYGRSSSNSIAPQIRTKESKWASGQISIDYNAILQFSDEEDDKVKVRVNQRSQPAPLDNTSDVNHQHNSQHQSQNQSANKQLHSHNLNSVESRAHTNYQQTSNHHINENSQQYQQSRQEQQHEQQIRSQRSPSPPQQSRSPLLPQQPRTPPLSQQPRSPAQQSRSPPLSQQPRSPPSSQQPRSPPQQRQSPPQQQRSTSPPLDRPPLTHAHNQSQIQSSPQGIITKEAQPHQPLPQPPSQKQVVLLKPQPPATQPSGLAPQSHRVPTHLPHAQASPPPIQHKLQVQPRPLQQSHNPHQAQITNTIQRQSNHLNPAPRLHHQNQYQNAISRPHHPPNTQVHRQQPQPPQSNVHLNSVPAQRQHSLLSHQNNIQRQHQHDHLNRPSNRQSWRQSTGPPPPRGVSSRNHQSLGSFNHQSQGYFGNPNSTTLTTNNNGTNNSNTNSSVSNSYNSSRPVFSRVFYRSNLLQ